MLEQFEFGKIWCDVMHGEQLTGFTAQLDP